MLLPELCSGLNFYLNFVQAKIQVKIQVKSLTNSVLACKVDMNINRKNGGRGQVVRRWIVTPLFAGSNPVVRPFKCKNITLLPLLFTRNLGVQVTSFLELS